MALVHQEEQGTLEPETENYRQMRIWAEERGLVCPKMRYPVRFEPGYIGAQAIERIGPNEDIVRMPGSLVLGSQVARASAIGPVFESHPEVFSNPSLESEDLVLISFIISELPKAQTSDWYYLINSLPRDCENLSDWTESELEELHDPDLVHQLHQKDENMRLNWTAVSEIWEKYPHFFPAEFATYANFYWVWQNITTRAFGKYAPSSFFAPIADNLNHSYSHTHYIMGSIDEKQHCCPSLVCLDSDIDIPDSVEVNYSEFARMVTPHSSENNAKLLLLLLKAKEKDDQKAKEKDENKWGGPFEPQSNDYFRMTTGSDETYEAGAQLFLFYGQYSNRQLLLYYGFTLERNMYNYAVIKLKLEDLLPSESDRSRIPSDFQGKVFPFHIHHHSICTDLLSFLRMLHWNPSSHIVISFFSPQDYGLELEVVTHAHAILTEILERDGVSVEMERENRERGGGRGIRYHFAVRSR